MIKVLEAVLSETPGLCEFYFKNEGDPPNLGIVQKAGHPTFEQAVAAELSDFFKKEQR